MRASLSSVSWLLSSQIRIPSAGEVTSGEGKESCKTAGRRHCSEGPGWLEG